MNARLTYNDELHEYRLDGRVIPSVTQILHDLSSKAYQFVDRKTMEAAAALGTAVHRVIELDCRKTLNVETLHDDIVPYYGAWLNFVALSGFEHIASELRVCSTKYAYAGTLDLFGKFKSRYCVIDAKRTAQVPRTAGPQTAAYENAFRESPIAEQHGILPSTPIDRYALHLLPDGKYRLVPFTARNDLRVFLAAQTTYLWSNAA